MKTLTIAAALLAASSTAAFAGGPAGDRHAPDGRARFIESIDANKDGKVDKSEFAGMAVERAGKRFDVIDTEGKGVVSRDQFVAAAKSEAEKRFARFDANGDGILDRNDREGHRGWKGGPEDAPSPDELPE